jgi:ribosome-binding protein aMBF1 (putative translation factor)
VLYRRSRNLVVLLHIFRKDTGSIPQPEIELAAKRWDDFKARMDAKTPPSTARRWARRPLQLLTALSILVRCVSEMPDTRSPAGTSVAEARRRRARRSAAYRKEQARLAPFEEIARIVIKHRMNIGLTQAELAARMGTSHSAISRIESGKHPTTVGTLQRLAEALDLRFVVGFESGSRKKPVREVVTV